MLEETTTVPWARSKHTRRSPSVWATARPCSTLRIWVVSEWTGTALLVDVDSIVVMITSAMLSMLGFKVLSAMDGVEAVQVFRQHKDEIRFVLSDFAMPRMNGQEVLIALRRIAPSIPVILASGYSEEQVMNGSQHECPQAFLAKPYGLQELKEAIRHSLAGRRE